MDRRNAFGLLIAAFALAAIAALSLPLRLPLGPNAWDTAVYLDAVQRIRMGQVPSLDFFAPVGPLGYYGAALLDTLFPSAQPMLLVNWALLPVLLPMLALLCAHIEARSRRMALALLLPFLLFASLPINLHSLYPMPGFDGYGHYNRHVALLLYLLIATLLFVQDRRLTTGMVAGLMLTLFLVKITGAVTGTLMVGYAILAGRLRLRLRDAVVAAALVLAALGALDLATGLVRAYIADILALLALNTGALLPRFLTVAAGDDMAAIADGDRDVGHQSVSSPAITVSSATIAASIRARSASWRFASAACARSRSETAASIRAMARSIRSIAAGDDTSAITGR